MRWPMGAFDLSVPSANSATWGPQCSGGGYAFFGYAPKVTNTERDPSHPSKGTIVVQAALSCTTVGLLEVFKNGCEQPPMTWKLLWGFGRQEILQVTPGRKTWYFSMLVKFWHEVLTSTLFFEPGSCILTCPWNETAAPWGKKRRTGGPETRKLWLRAKSKRST